MKIYDIHTHRLQHNGIVAAEPNIELLDGYLYSIGLHPWHITADTDFGRLEEVCSNDRVVAIGECGIDRLTKTPLPLQEKIFMRHIDISECLHKPMIIHCVRAFDRLLAIHRHTRPTQPWIVHGFRQKPVQASRLLEKGIYISLGSKFNDETARIIPPERLFIETDDNPTSDIIQIAVAVAASRQTTPDEILTQVAENASAVIHRL